MKKRILIILMLLVFVLPKTVQAVTDIENTKYEEEVNYLIENEIIKGYPDDTYKPEKSITRAEFTTIVTKLKKLNLIEEKTSRFNDIDNHWGKPYINTLVENGFVSGYLDNTFKPDNNVTYAEATAILINSLGYKEEVESLGLEWPKNYTTYAKNVGLYKKLEIENENNKMNRGEVAILVYNANNIDFTMDKAKNELKEINSVEDIYILNDTNVVDIEFREDETIEYISDEYTTIPVKSLDDAIYSLNAIKGIIGIENPEEEFIGVSENEFLGNIMYRVNQVYKGVEVFGRELVISVDESGKIISFLGYYQKEINIDVKPDITEEDAEKLVLSIEESVEISGESKLVIYILKDNMTLAYKVDVLSSEKTEEIIDKTIFIDAKSGNIIDEISNIDYSQSI